MTDQFYATALDELESGRADRALLGKALVSAGGDQTKQKSEYIKLRVNQQTLAAKEFEKQAMANATSLYAAGRPADAVKGLQLLVQNKRDANAMVCLANIYLHGVPGHPIDKDKAMELLASAESSKIPDVRRFVGEILEPLGDWQRTLANYEYAARHGNLRARSLASDLRARLVEAGTMAPREEPKDGSPVIAKSDMRPVKRLREPSYFGWVGATIVALVTVKVLGPVGGLTTFGSYYFLQPRIGTFFALVCSAAAGIAVGIGLTVLLLAKS